MKRIFGSLVICSFLLWGCSSKQKDSLQNDLQTCATAATCGLAFSKAVAQEQLDGPTSLAAIETGLLAASEFPEIQPAFLESAGLDLAGLFGAIDALITKMGQQASDAALVFKALKEPVCENFIHLDDVKADFAPAASLLKMTTLGHLVSAAEPDKADVIAAGAELLIGCTMSERTLPDAMVVEMRNRFYDLVDKCPKDAIGVVERSCQVARTVMQEKTLPLPLPSVASGDFAGAILPVGHGTGLRLNPSWVLVLSAGHLSVLDQRVLQPGVRTAGESEISDLFDLRRPHQPNEVLQVLREVMSSRTAIELDDRSKVVALAVDQSTVFSDLAEVLEALMVAGQGTEPGDSSKDIHPVIAALPAGFQSPMWVPVNYRMSYRVLMDPVGKLIRYPAKGKAMNLALTPFFLSTVDAPKKSAEFVRNIDSDGIRQVDLRPGHNLVSGLVKDGYQPFAKMSVAGAVPAGLLVSMLDGLANDFRPEALASAGAYATARMQFGKMGRPQLLMSAIVIRPEGAPAE